MPLIDFRTNLTNLKYGDPNTGDRPGGGYSGQPYIKFPIDGPGIPDAFRTYYDINRNSSDFPMRGGPISDILDATISGKLDRERIEKFFNDKPRGTTFLQKQVGLQLSNPRIQVPQTFAFLGETFGNIVLPVTQTYNPLNTLLQVAVQGTGVHANRHGISPTINESVRQTYEYYAGNPDNNTAATNRLAILQAIKLTGDTGFTLDSSVVAGIGIDPNLVDRMGIAITKNKLFDYSGGPGSTYGIGFTSIDRVVDTDETAKAYSGAAMTYQQLAAQKRTNDTEKYYPKLQDFRKYLSGSQKEFGYDDSIETRLGTGNQGGPGQTTDTVNARRPFYYDTTATPWVAGNTSDNSETTTDIIKFTFECLDNTSPGNAVALVFRAFLDGAITDNHSADYNTFRYLGRGETFRTYQGFNRVMGFSFKVAARSSSEIRPLYTKLNHLISQLYPDYSFDPATKKGSNIMRGNVVRLTIGDYIYRMPGYLESVNVTIENSNTPWDIVLGEDTADRELPHLVTVSCTFYPIMDILPRKEKHGDPHVPLIVNRDDSDGPEGWYMYWEDPTPVAPPNERAADTPSSTTTTTTEPDYGPVGPVNQPPQQPQPSNGSVKSKPKRKRKKGSGKSVNLSYVNPAKTNGLQPTGARLRYVRPKFTQERPDFRGPGSN